MRPPLAEKPVIRSNLETYFYVLHALMLRDMRTRFGGSYWGYGLVVLWPVAHIFLIVGIMYFRGLSSPMGGDPILFVATGAVPALVFQYTSRESMKALTVNKPLIYYPQVKTFDIILARFIVEIIKGFTGLILVAIILLCIGIDPVPEFPALSLGGYCAAILFGLGVGSVNIGIMSFFPAWLWGYMLLSILIYVSSGVFFLAHMLPGELYSWMKWNPVVQIIEWVRLGYNPQLGVSVDYYYVLGCGFGSLSAGLVMERIFVRRLA